MMKNASHRKIPFAEWYMFDRIESKFVEIVTVDPLAKNVSEVNKIVVADALWRIYEDYYLKQTDLEEYFDIPDYRVIQR